MVKKVDINNLSEEALAFTNRTVERTEQGFHPDLQNLNEVKYFYKSFWRHPHLAKLYVGEMSKNFITKFKSKLKSKAKILDFGCGPGYFSLELAREGFDVVGIDISEGSINSAKSVLSNLKNEDLKLKYHIGSNDYISNLGKFDGILCSGILHHLPDLKTASKQFNEVLNPKGIIVMHEPQHLKYTKNDALVVYLIRKIVQFYDGWYEKDQNLPKNNDDIKNDVQDIFEEYINERDKNEIDGQSPNDLTFDKEEIIKYMQNDFVLLDTKSSFSFIYRLIGGLRGEQDKINELASFLTMFDKHAVSQSLLNANYFYATFEKKI